MSVVLGLMLFAVRCVAEAIESQKVRAIADRGTTRGFPFASFSLCPARIEGALRGRGLVGAVAGRAGRPLWPAVGC